MNDFTKLPGSKVVRNALLWHNDEPVTRLWHRYGRSVQQSKTKCLATWHEMVLVASEVLKEAQDG